MKNNLTQLVFILDRSGSMSGLEKNTIDGFNEMIFKQKQSEIRTKVTTVLFDDHYELLHDQINLQEIEKISEKEYYVRGSTALLDAVGKTIHKIIECQKKSTAKNRANKVMFVIITDGMENSSRQFTYEKLNNIILYQKKKYNWEFIFLGANINAKETAYKFGIEKNRSSNFISDAKGTKLNYKIISETISNFRKASVIKEDWYKEIEYDYKNRSLNK